MISSILGTIDYISDKFVILNTTAGLGYRIFISKETAKNISQEKGEIKFYTHLYVRENSLDLFGFLSFAELSFFEKLITISGVGPKTALNILAIAPPKSLVAAIAKGDIKFLTQVSGIGKRIAEKIILELKEKIEEFGFGPEDLTMVLDSDALEALVSLGYKVNEARDALHQVNSEITAMEDRVREALRILGR